jgi:hypothetical protein
MRLHPPLGRDALAVSARVADGDVYYSYLNLAVVGWKPDGGGAHDRD